MYHHPDAWHALLDKLAGVVTAFLRAQIKAGARAVQLFDSWVGCLTPDDYRTYVLAHTRQVIEGVRDTGAPVVHFATGAATLLEAMREAGGDVIGVDWRMPLDDAWQRLGDGVGIQGNLDPIALFAPMPELSREWMISCSEPGIVLAISSTSAMASCRRRPSTCASRGRDGACAQQATVVNGVVCTPSPSWGKVGIGGGAGFTPTLALPHRGGGDMDSDYSGRGFLVETHASPPQPQMTGVLLMAHGSPDNLDDMAAYLQHVRGGRPTPQALVDDIRERYRLIGGRSPLLDLTRAQGKALEQRLNVNGTRFRVYIGMRHWHPFIKDTVQADRGRWYPPCRGGEHGATVLTTQRWRLSTSSGNGADES